jgi:two-component system alkaline phosphatase synthesis response regulator PhoP
MFRVQQLFCRAKGDIECELTLSVSGERLNQGGITMNPHAASGGDASRRRKIVVVDDDPGFAQAVALLLEHSGYQTFTAHNGDEGLKLCRTHDPDVVILDVMMPGVDGFEVCRVFKEVWGANRPQILILSGITAGLKVNVAKLLEESLADSFLPKPYKADELLSEIGLLIKRIEDKSVATPKG